MKKTIIKITLAAAITAASGIAAMYPPQEGDLVASIPFSFQVGAKAMAPGEYLVRPNSDGTIEICEDAVYCAILQAARSTSRGKDTRILFAGSGDQRQMIGLAGGQEENFTGQQNAVQTRPLQIDRFAGMDLAPAWR
jgi:hypothetical protein